MHIDDIIRALKPILGERINPLIAIYLAGDDENKRTAERILRLTYLQMVSGIQAPREHLGSGKYPLGVVFSGEKPLHPISLRDGDWFHVGIFGQTGRGKTNAMLNLLQGLTAQGIPWLVFDWKRAGYRDLLATHPQVHVFTVGRDISPFSFNPLIPPPRVELIAWFKQFIQCISHAYFLGHGCEVIFQDVLGKDTQTLFDVLKKLHTYPANWRKLQWLQSTERAVKALCYGTISHVLNVEHTPPIHHWLNQNIVFELDALTESEAKFFVEILMSAIYFYKRENQHRALHVSVIEEAHHLLQKENWNVEAKSVMDKIFREIREYGEALVVIDQMPSTLLHSAFANTSTLIAFSLTHNEDVDAVARAMLLSREEQQVIGRLPVGTALVKLQNRWPAAFLVRVPLVANQWGRISDEAIQARVLGHLPKQEVMPLAMKPVGVITPEVRAIYAQIRQGSPETTISEISRQEIHAAIERVKKGRKPNPKIARIWERVLVTPAEAGREVVHTDSEVSSAIPEIANDWYKLKKHLESILESQLLNQAACMGLGHTEKTNAKADERVIHSGKEVIHTGSEVIHIPGRTDEKVAEVIHIKEGVIHSKTGGCAPNWEVLHTDSMAFPIPDKVGKKLLESIVKDQFMNILERYRKLGLHHEIGRRGKQKLLTQGVIKEVSIKTPHGRVKLLELTEKGKAMMKTVCPELGDLTSSLRHGKAEHLYGIQLAKKRLVEAGYRVEEEYPIGNGKTVDIVIIGKKKRIAVEVETGKSDVLGNIRKCLQAGFDGVVSLATNKKTLEKIKAEVSQLSKEEQEKVRVRGVWD